LYWKKNESAFSKGPAIIPSLSFDMQTQAKTKTAANFKATCHSMFRVTMVSFLSLSFLCPPYIF